MAALTLTSPHRRPLRPLVEGAIQNELRLLEAGVGAPKSACAPLRPDTA